MLEHKQWWDSIDFIASHLVGNLFRTFESIEKQYFKKWVNSSDMWLNRTAILFQLNYKAQTNTDLLQQSIVPHIKSSAFFHQKAIGWALRQYAKTNQQWVKNFVNTFSLKPLSHREATKYF